MNNLDRRYKKITEELLKLNQGKLVDLVETELQKGGKNIGEILKECEKKQRKVLRLVYGLGYILDKSRNNLSYYNIQPKMVERN